MVEDPDLTTKDTTRRSNTTLQTAIPVVPLTDQVVQAALLTADLEAMTGERDLVITETIERRDTTLLTVTQVTLRTDPAALQIIHGHLKDIIIIINVITIIIDIAPEAAVNHIKMGQVHGSPSSLTLKKWLMIANGKTGGDANI